MKDRLGSEIIEVAGIMFTPLIKLRVRGRMLREIKKCSSFGRGEVG